MNLLLSGAEVFFCNELRKADVLIAEGRIKKIAPEISKMEADSVLNLENKVLVPGFVDVHVHLREPGFSYKETMQTGTLAAARGGYTTVCTMPNLNPVPDSKANLNAQLDVIARDAKVKVVPYGSITIEERGETLANLEEMAPHVVAFSDDGVGVQSEELMRSAMAEAKRVGKLIVAHAEDERYLNGSFVHDGVYAREHGLAVNPSKSEWMQVKRDIALAEETGCGYHVCHVSTKESVALVREAKARGVNVSCETAPHYLVLCDEALEDSGNFRMNPPIRGREDRAALLAGIRDGTVDMIATDHAPHSAEEKAGGLMNSANGIVGLEVAFPVLYTHLVKTGEITLTQLLHLMCVVPRKRFGLEGGKVETGAVADLTVLDLENEYKINPETFASKGRSTPFAGWTVMGEVVLTMVDGRVAWKKDGFNGSV